MPIRDLGSGGYACAGNAAVEVGPTLADIHTHAALADGGTDPLLTKIQLEPWKDCDGFAVSDSHCIRGNYE